MSVGVVVVVVTIIIVISIIIIIIIIIGPRGLLGMQSWAARLLALGERQSNVISCIHSISTYIYIYIYIARDIYIYI